MSHVFKTLLLIILALGVCVPIVADDEIVFDGQVLQCSRLPQNKLDYPDCDFCIEVKVLGTSSAHIGINEKISLSVPFTRNFEIEDSSKTQIGKTYRFHVYTADNIPASRRQMMLIDDLNLFEDRMFYVKKIVNDNGAQQPGSRSTPQAPIHQIEHANKKSIPAFTPMTQAQTEFIENLIKRRLSELESRIAKCDYALLEKKYADALKRHKGNFYICPNGYWYKQGNGYFFLNKKYQLPSRHNNVELQLDNVQALNKFCLERGINFIYVIIPNPNAIACRVMLPELKNEIDSFYGYCIAALLKRGVNTFYAIDKIIDAAEKYPFLYFYTISDFHPDFGTMDVISDLIQESLIDVPVADQEKMDGAFELREVPYSFHKMRGQKYPDIPIFAGKNNDVMKTLTVFYDGKEITNTDFAERSSILVAGNSFTQTPTNCFLPAIMEMKLKRRVSYFLRPGSTAFNSLITEFLARQDISNVKNLILVDTISYAPIFCGINIYHHLNQIETLNNAVPFHHIEAKDVQYGKNAVTVKNDEILLAENPRGANSTRIVVRLPALSESLDHKQIIASLSIRLPQSDAVIFHQNKAMPYINVSSTKVRYVLVLSEEEISNGELSFAVKTKHPSEIFLSGDFYYK